ncbi:S-layer protein [Candidatus Nanohaloarchaea archaeon]|nr:S-layer protein [Candidatus Nanohaloarchaea archaeon]
MTQHYERHQKTQIIRKSCSYIRTTRRSNANRRSRSSSSKLPRWVQWVGATLTGAAGLAAASSHGGSSGNSYTLADYPHPFVDDNGNVDASVVVGSDGKQADVVSAIDIAGQLGNSAFSSETVEGTAGAVNGEALDEVTVGTELNGGSSSLTIDASDYSGFVRKTVEDDDGNDVFVTESASIGDGVTSRINGTTTDIAVNANSVDYTVTYSPGFSVNDTVTLLGEEYELTNIEDGQVELGSSMEKSVKVGDSFTHGPYTVEVTGKTESDPAEVVVRVSEGEEVLDTKSLNEGEEITVDNEDFTVSAESVIFYADGQTDITLESTYTDTTLESGEEFPMDNDYKVQSLGTQTPSNSADSLQSIKLTNQVKTVDEPEDEDEIGYVETGQAFEGPNGYFNVTNQGLTNEATTEIGISSGGEVDFTDAQSFDASVDMSELDNGNDISSDDVTTGIKSDEGYVPLHITDFQSGDQNNAEVTVEYQNFEHTFSPSGTTSTGAQDGSTKLSGTGLAVGDLVAGEPTEDQEIYFNPGSSHKTISQNSQISSLKVDNFNQVASELNYEDVEISGEITFEGTGDLEQGDQVKFMVSAGSSDGIAETVTYTVPSGGVGGTGATTLTLDVTIGDNQAATDTSQRTYTIETASGTSKSETGTLDIENDYDQVNIAVENIESGSGTTNSIDVADATLDITSVDTTAASSSLGSQGLDYAGRNNNVFNYNSQAVSFGIYDYAGTASSSNSVDSGYGFSVAPNFVDTDGDTSTYEAIEISNADDKLTTQYGAVLDWTSGNSNLVVTEEDGGNSNDVVVDYMSGGDTNINQVNVDGGSTLTDTDDGDSTLTNWGSAVELDSDSSATVTYPDEQRYQMAAFGAVGEGSSSGQVMSPTGWPASTAQLDTEASKDQNLVLVGGPLVNDLTADLASQGDTWNATQYENNKDVGVLDLVNNAFNGNTALVVAGWNAEDTSAAADYLVENQGASALEGKTTAQVNTNTGELVQ